MQGPLEFRVYLIQCEKLIQILIIVRPELNLHYKYLHVYFSRMENYLIALFVESGANEQRSDDGG